jgi:hypothetical protein
MRKDRLRVPPAMDTGGVRRPGGAGELLLKLTADTLVRR